MKYPASSSYHLTRLVFMKMSLYTQHFHSIPHTCTGKTLFFRYWRNLLQQQGIVTLQSYTHYNATHKRREKRRSSLKRVVQVQPDLTVICHAHDGCSIVMSVHMTHQYLSECHAVKYPRLVTKQRHEKCFYAFIDRHLQWTTAVAMLPVLSLISNIYIRWCL